MLGFLANPALAADPEPVANANSGDTAWILVSTALVLFMTIPALALFYGGLVRTKNVLSVLMHCFAMTALISVLWVVFGYSVAFSDGNQFFGGLSKVLLGGGVRDHLASGTKIPETLFCAFQMTFAIITPALVIGAFVERMKFLAVMLFSALWLIVVYLPICHMTWGGGWFSELGVMDFAGGIVVHITAGVAALVACIMVGKRKGYPDTQMIPHNLTYTVIGSAMLWVGWFGFNAGSALAANGQAAMALLVTHLSAATATLTWMLIEWKLNGKPSVLGAATGAIAGLAAVTPASGFIGPEGGLAIGFASGALCYFASTAVKKRFAYDDSLDVVGVHGVGGFIGVVMVAFFASEALGGGGYAEGVGMGAQLKAQLIGGGVTIVYTLVASIAVFWVIDKLVGLRVSEEDEEQGLDLAEHAETGYSL
ncbi:MAG: ammonia channel protein [Planctomycetes bacterium]|nr:ammonia channel protein [Planctomycetota bacterium]MBL04057.1 ammonia channel protein [Planctomycetota bacterium]